MIRLARDLTFPVDVATQTLLLVGKRGSGKTSTGVRLVEQLLKAGVPCLVIDPTDVWWGLKAKQDGSRGFPVYVFGGRHQDLALDPGSGALIADVVVEHRVSAVLSVKTLSGGERTRLVTDFARRLFQRNTEPMHLVLEEAHELAPQSDFRGSEEMLGAIKRIWKLGRSSGIGGTAITQRPASLHKDVTTQAEILVVHRTLGPQDVAAVKAWIQYHGQSEEILGSLSELKTGEAWVWAPDFPEEKPLGLKRTVILPRETFDSSATPKHGVKITEPRQLAAVDLERLRSKLSSALEKAKADDPRELRLKAQMLQTKVSQLERAVQLAAKDRDGTRLVREAKPLVVNLKALEAGIDRLAVEHGRFCAAMAASLDKLAQRQQVVVSELETARDVVKRAGAVPSTVPAARPIGVEFEFPGGKVQRYASDVSRRVPRAARGSRDESGPRSDLRDRGGAALMLSVFAALPTYDGTRHNAAAVAYLTGRCAQVMESRHSLLCRGFNELWGAALNRLPRERWFLMLHADVIPTTPDWLAVVIQEAEANGADVLSVVLPIKDERGWTSTATDTDPWRPERLRNFQVPLETTWTNPHLLVNTGLMLVRLARPWVEAALFETRDRISKDEKGRFVADVEPEDWRFSRLARSLGASVWATTKIQAKHVGRKEW